MVAGESVRLNTDVLDQLVTAGEALRDRIGGEPLRADALLALRGVVEVTAPVEDEPELEQRNAAMLKSFGEVIAFLAVAFLAVAFPAVAFLRVSPPTPRLRVKK